MCTYPARAIIRCHADSCPPSPPEVKQCIFRRYLSCPSVVRDVGIFYHSSSFSFSSSPFFLPTYSSLSPSFKLQDPNNSMSWWSNAAFFYVSLLWNFGITVKRWDGEMDWYRAMVKQIWWNETQRIHTDVHMVKWWDGEMDWYRAMVKWIWWNGAHNTHPCSHGEMEIWRNGEVQRIQRWNGVTVKQLYSPLTSIGFLVPSNVDLSHFFTSSDAVSPVDEKFVCEWCRSDCIFCPRAAAMPFDAVSPCFHPINFSFSFYY